MLGLAPDAAADDCVRVGVDARLTADHYESKAIGLNAERALGGTSLRVRLERGRMDSKYGRPDLLPPGVHVPFGVADLWRLTAGVEGRRFGSPEVAFFAAIYAGAMRLDGGFTEGQARYRGYTQAQAGVEWRAGPVRFRLAFELGAMVGPELEAFDRVTLLPGESLGVDVAF